MCKLPVAHTKAGDDKCLSASTLRYLYDRAAERNDRLVRRGRIFKWLRESCMVHRAIWTKDFSALRRERYLKHTIPAQLLTRELCRKTII